MIYRYINMEQLSREPEAGRLLGWVLAANDLALTFYLQDHFQKMISDMHIREFVVGSRLYVDRLMCAQTYEAICMAPVCQSLILFKRCIAAHQPAVEAFQRMLKLNEEPLPDEHKALLNLLRRVRDKGTFHYYSKRDKNVASWLQEALELRSAAGITRGTMIHSADHLFTRFAFADDVFAEVFFRKILQTDTENQTLEQEIVRLSEVLTEAASDVRVVGDTIGKELLHRYPA